MVFRRRRGESFGFQVYFKSRFPDRLNVRYERKREESKRTLRPLA